MLAWCHQTPKDASQPNGARFGVSPPDVDDRDGHLPVIFDEMGVFLSYGMGASPLTFTEMQSWSETAGFPLLPREVQMIHSMSTAYCSIANTDDAPCPVESDAIRESIDMVNIRAMIAMAQTDE